MSIYLLSYPDGRSEQHATVEAAKRSANSWVGDDLDWEKEEDSEDLFAFNPLGLDDEVFNICEFVST